MISAVMPRTSRVLAACPLTSELPPMLTRTKNNSATISPQDKVHRLFLEDTIEERE
jgi:hypothetical protein